MYRMSIFFWCLRKHTALRLMCAFLRVRAQNSLLVEMKSIGARALRHIQKNRIRKREKKDHQNSNSEKHVSMCKRCCGVCTTNRHLNGVKWIVMEGDTRAPDVVLCCMQLGFRTCSHCCDSGMRAFFVCLFLPPNTRTCMCFYLLQPQETCPLERRGLLGPFAMPLLHAPHVLIIKQTTT